MTNEQKNQVAAMNASGMSVDEIVIDTGLDKSEVEAFVAERNRKKGKGKPLTPETIAQVEDLTRKGWTITDIKAKIGISPASISRIRSGMKTEKEPAAAATATDSDIKTLQIQDSTKTVESQALRGVNVLGILECALSDAYGTDAEIMSLKAHAAQLEDRIKELEARKPETETVTVTETVEIKDDIDEFRAHFANALDSVARLISFVKQHEDSKNYELFDKKLRALADKLNGGT